MRSGWWGALWKLGISLFLVAVLVHRYGGDETFRTTLRQLRLSSFLIAAAAVSGGLVLSALRWKILLAAAGVALPLGVATRLYFIGYFFNLFLPTTVGGDLVRGAGVPKDVPLSVVGSSILMERVLGFGCLLGLGIAASWLRPEMGAVRVSLSLTGLAYAVGVFALAFVPLPDSSSPGRRGRLLRGLRRTGQKFRAFGFHGPALFAGAALSLGWQIALVLANAALSSGLGGVAPLPSLLALVPVVQAAGMIPVSFGGLGVREMGYEFFFRESGLDPAGAVALAAGFLGVTFALALVGGALYLIAPVRGRIR